MNSENPYQAPRAKIEVPVVSSAGLPLAGRGTRLGAQIIDTLIMLPIVGLLMFVFGWFSETRLEAVSLLEQLGVSAISIGIWLAINFQLLTNGQTIGKKAVGIKIVRSNGDATTAGHIIIRRFLPLWLLVHVPYLGNLLALVDALLIFRQSRKCLHDDIADTIVVQTGTASPQRV
jgi:uncharacterized RDD family membrane protein YckC